MQPQFFKFHLIFTPKVKQQLDSLSPKDRKQYDKAFQILSKSGPAYRSLRTHRYKHFDCDTWGSSASMSKRFYWHYVEVQNILVTNLDSH
ncbi:hypothetical protein [Iningainema tapete]|uniref:Uncharacterized protein n=1 Tax=Iningainema tapete BLCC-T55 TaxID=2748662 RepID=A0A8J7BXB6_9CYAN|nr:hypothetical protein [Iningainema tapete]MBD2772623.1 hypothetical protein [Iningainema tapete BLCC-T55]